MLPREMERRLVALFFLAFVSQLATLSCAALSSPSASRHRAEPPVELALTVANAANPAMVLPGVNVRVVMTSGSVVDVGETDQFGDMLIPKELLQPHQGLVVTACAKWFFCGALFIDDTDLAGFDEYFLSMAV